MKKKVKSWSVEKLGENFPRIEFPEYQREPNLWSLIEKQRLIDSMIRRFDIASLYLYQHEDGSIDCVDGRQRIGAIMAFLGRNHTDKHANFQFKHLNEIYEDDPLFRSLEGKTFDEIDHLKTESRDADAKGFVTGLMSYPLTVVMLSESRESQEFNLQFTRLNLGTIINSGEKLHAMVGELRDECFDRLGTHPFLENTNIPTRRFAREQVAAQILAQVFSKRHSNAYTRTRHFDLQRLFKQNSMLTEEQRILVGEVSDLFGLLGDAFSEINVLRNRAITVSTVLLARECQINTQAEASELARFIEEFVRRLNWQVRKGLVVDQEYHHLAEFQRYITQASAESYSVEARTEMLEEEFYFWKKMTKLRGDAEFEERTGLAPSNESRPDAASLFDDLGRLMQSDGQAGH